MLKYFRKPHFELQTKAQIFGEKIMLFHYKP